MLGKYQWRAEGNELSATDPTSENRDVSNGWERSNQLGE